MLLNVFMNLWIYAFPFPALYFFYHHWLKAGSSFALFMIVVPTLYGYIVPGIGTNIMKKWQFTGKLRIGRIYFHHGFKYAANMNLWFFLATYGRDLTNLSTTEQLLVALQTGTMHAFYIWCHDIWCISKGKIILESVLVKPGMSAIDKATSYAPATFWTLGTTFGFCAAYAANTDSLSVLLGALALTFMITTSSTVFAALEFGAKREA